MSRRKLIAFGWYGGKYSHLNWLLPLLLYTKHYCEPFGGSAAVLINRQPSPIETYNDLDGQVVNFFEVLRSQTEELLKAIGLTPFSREEFGIAVASRAADLTKVEMARRFFVCARQARTGLAQTASRGQWAHCILASRAGMAGNVSRWLGSIDGLPEVAQRLLRIQIENAPAIEVIQRYDSPETFFYCDPPYAHESRSSIGDYIYEMTDDEHCELADVLHKVEGRVAVSGYHSELMDKIYGDWKHIDSSAKEAPSTRTSPKDKKRRRVETLWINYRRPQAPLDFQEKTIGSPPQKPQGHST